MSGGHDKTEKPTPKRRKQARKDGQIARTAELGQWLTVLLLSLTIGPMLSHEMTAWREIFEASLRAIASPEPGKALDLFGAGMRHAFFSIITLGGLVMIVGVGASVAQGGMIFSTKAVKPNLKKLDLIQGFKKVFGPQALWQGAKILLKSAVVALIGYVATPVEGGAECQPMRLVAEAMTDLGVIATAAADNRFDHAEQPEVERRADHIIEILTPISSRGHAA